MKTITILFIFLVCMTGIYKLTNAIVYTRNPAIKTETISTDINHEEWIKSGKVAQEGHSYTKRQVNSYLLKGHWWYIEKIPVNQPITYYDDNCNCNNH